MCCRKDSKRRAKSSALWDITCRATISLQKNKHFTLSFLVSYILFISSAPPPPSPPFFYSFRLFYTRKELQVSFILFNFSYIYIYIYIYIYTHILLHSKICLLHSFLYFTFFNFTSATYTSSVTSLHITAFSFISLYTSHLSLVVHNSSIRTF
jgi:hypothetical protein